MFDFPPLSGKSISLLSINQLQTIWLVATIHHYPLTNPAYSSITIRFPPFQSGHLFSVKLTFANQSTNQSINQTKSKSKSNQTHSQSKSNQIQIQSNQNQIKSKYIKSASKSIPIKSNPIKSNPKPIKNPIKSKLNPS